MTRASLLLLLPITAVCMACSPKHTSDPDGVAPLADGKLYFSLIADGDRTSITQQSTQFSFQDYNKSLRNIALTLLGREPTPEEILTSADDFNDYQTRVQTMINSELAFDQLRTYFNIVFEMSGKDGNVNFEEPTNLALYIFKEDKDFREILKADYCVDDELSPIPCSAFSSEQVAKEQAAGAMTTRAFLTKWDAAFNFRRVAKAFKTFACSEYPDSTDMGLPRVEISNKVKSFDCVDCDTACYSCHKTMNPRASLFYDYTPSGMFMPNPTSRNDMAKTDTGAVSTRLDILNPGSQPKYHGRDINKLQTYARYLADSRKFRDCFAQRLTNFMIGANANQKLSPEFESIRNNVVWNAYSIKKVLLEISIHPSFIRKATPL